MVINVWNATAKRTSCASTSCLATTTSSASERAWRWYGRTSLPCAATSSSSQARTGATTSCWVGFVFPFLFIFFFLVSFIFLFLLVFSHPVQERQGLALRHHAGLVLFSCRSSFLVGFLFLSVIFSCRLCFLISFLFCWFFFLFFSWYFYATTVYHRKCIHTMLSTVTVHYHKLNK